jgi:hypothetical protein
MKKIACSTLALGVAFAIGGSAHARNVKYLLPISAALEAPDIKEKPDGSVKFFFGKQETPTVVARLGSDAPYHKSTTRRTSDDFACKRAFLLALVALEKRAKQLGANGVINIISYFRNSETSSMTEFECHAGASAGVGLRGDFVKISQR